MPNRAAVAAFSLILALLLLSPALPGHAANATDPARPDAPGKRKIAILAFEAINDEAKQGNKGRMVSEMFTTAAVNSGIFAVVERHLIEKVLEEMEFGKSEISGTVAQKIGAMVGADAVLTGSVTQYRDDLRIDARLISVADGQILLASADTAKDSLGSIIEATDKSMRTIVASLDPEAAKRLQAQASQPSPPRPTPQSHSAAPASPKAPAAPVQASKPAPAGKPGPVDPEAFAKAEAHKNKGNEYKSRNELDKAMAEYDAAIAILPDYANPYNNRGNVWTSRKDYDKAITEYNKAIALNPGLVEPYNNRGAVWHAKKEMDKAIADYTKALEIKPDFHAAYFNRALSWEEKKNYDQAIADCTKAIEIQPDYAKAYNTRGHVWGSKKNDLDKAIADFTKAIEIQPDYARAYGNRAFAWKAKGNFPRAKADAEKAKQLDPSMTIPTF